MSENLNLTVRDQIQPEEFEIIPVKGTQHGLIDHKNIKYKNSKLMIDYKRDENP